MSNEWGGGRWVRVEYQGDRGRIDGNDWGIEKIVVGMWIFWCIFAASSRGWRAVKNFNQPFKTKCIMAHIKSIVVGKGSYGSIGDVTVRTVGGKVIASQKISRKGGLSTYRQVLQQIRMANVMRAYSELNQSAPNGNGMSQAFPDRPEGLSNVNMFMKYNYAKPEVYAITQTKEEAARDLLVPAPFVVTRGTLPEVSTNFTIQQEDEESSTAAAIITPAVLTIGSTTTYGDLCTALMAVMPEVRQGDALTFFVMSYKPLGAPATKIFAIQLIMDATSTELLVDIADLDIETVSGHAAININQTLLVSGFDYDFAVALGRNGANGYAVSDSQFTDNMLTSDSYQAHVGDTKEMEAALSYGFKEDPFLQQSLD